MANFSKEVTELLCQSHPNSGSPHRTPTTMLIDVHYAELALIERWTWDRFTRLASFSGLTTHELGAIACIPHSTIERWPEKNLLPTPRTQGAYAQALILTLLEANALKAYTNDVIRDPFPALGEISSAVATGEGGKASRPPVA